MTRELKDKTIQASVWAAISQFLTVAVQFAISVVLANLLSPEDFGLMVISMIFVGFSSVLSAGGIAAAVVQRSQADVNDRFLSTAFWLNALFGLVTTLIIVAASPLISLFFEHPELTGIVSLSGLTTLIASLGMVHRAVLQRNLNFRQLGAIDVIAVVIGGIVGIWSAVAGEGVYALVYSSMARIGITTALLWLLIGWRPQRAFSTGDARKIMNFGGGLVGFSSFNYWVRRADDALIGKLLGSFELGIYSRAYDLLRQIVQQIGAIVGRVMFASLSSIQDDVAKVKAIYLRTINIISLFTFPLCLGMCVLAKPLVLVLYGHQWLETVPILRVLSLAGVTQSIGTTTGIIYQVKGRTDWLFRWGVFAGLYFVTAFVIGIQWGLLGLSIAYVLAGWSLTYFNFSIPGRMIGMTFWDVVIAVQRNLVNAILMAVVVLVVNYLLAAHVTDLQRLVTVVPLGIVVYFGLTCLLNPLAFSELKQIMSSIRGRTASGLPA